MQPNLLVSHCLKTGSDMASEELPHLTSKQSAFIDGLLQGKSASDAYRAAYDCSKMADRSIWCEASKLRSNPKVAQWLRCLQRMSLDATRLTLEAHLGELAIAHSQIRAAVQAEHHHGKAAGLYGDASRVGGPSDTELLEAIEKLLGKEMAEEIGAALTGPVRTSRDRL